MNLSTYVTYVLQRHHKDRFPTAEEFQSAQTNWMKNKSIKNDPMEQIAAKKIITLEELESLLDGKPNPYNDYVLFQEDYGIPVPALETLLGIKLAEGEEAIQKQLKEYEMNQRTTDNPWVPELPSVKQLEEGIKIIEAYRKRVKSEINLDEHFYFAEQDGEYFISMEHGGTFSTPFTSGSAERKLVDEIRETYKEKVMLKTMFSDKDFDEELYTTYHCSFKFKGQSEKVEVIPYSLGKESEDTHIVPMTITELWERHLVTYRKLNDELNGKLKEIGLE